LVSKGSARIPRCALLLFLGAYPEFVFPSAFKVYSAAAIELEMNE